MEVLNKIRILMEIRLLHSVSGFRYLCASTMESIQLGDKTFIPYLQDDVIHEAVQRIAHRINEDYAGKKPLFLVVLNGAFLFAADLMRCINSDCKVSFVKLASYEGTSSMGQMKQLIGLNEDLKGRDIIVVEDIVDSGNTIVHLDHLLHEAQANSVAYAALLFKPKAYSKDIRIQYVGMEIPNDFIVGYGLDYDGMGRNLKDIWVIKS
jgi:hypoxanthine phosphoribosyltransferase